MTGAEQSASQAAVFIREVVTGHTDGVLQPPRTEGAGLAADVDRKVVERGRSLQGRRLDPKLRVAEYRWQHRLSQVDADERP